MKDEKILKRAIEKAVGNGMKGNNHTNYYMTCWKNYFKDDLHYGLIFSHSFAKAYWSTFIYTECCACGAPLKGEPVLKWQYHLQQLVLEEEPLKYLERFL